MKQRVVYQTVEKGAPGDAAGGSAARFKNVDLLLERKVRAYWRLRLFQGQLEGAEDQGGPHSTHAMPCPRPAACQLLPLWPACSFAGMYPQLPKDHAEPPCL